MYDIDELERLEREATAGPWTVAGDMVCDIIHVALASADRRADAVFMASLRNAAPDLIATARLARRLAEALEERQSRGVEHDVDGPLLDEARALGLLDTTTPAPSATTERTT